MPKQLSLYEKLENGAGRDVWRSEAKTFRSTYKIPVKNVIILPGWNARTIFEGIEELAEDILQNGLNEPLEGVMDATGKFMLTDGERRFRAIQLLRKRKEEGFDEVEVVPVPKSMKAPDIIIRMLSSGVQKSMYKEVEVANGLLRLKTDFELSNDEIGKKMGRSRQWVDNMIKLAKAPEPVKKEVAEGKIKKTAVVVPQKEDIKEVAAGLTKPAITPGLPPSLKTENKKAEEQQAQAGAGIAASAPATNVSGKDALQGVNFDKEVNEQEALINRIAKNLNKIEPLGKGLNDQGQKDLDTYLGCIRKDVEELKQYYSKIKNRQVK